MSRSVNFVWLEGQLEEPASRRLLAEVPLDASSAMFKVAGGHGKFWARARSFDAAAHTGLLIVGLADLEQEPCAGGLLAEHLPSKRAETFILRIAVRMLESWLFADRERMAAFLHAPENKLPADPDRETHPKRQLVQLARRHAPAGLRRDLVPEEGHSGIVGPGYRPRVEQFIVDRWRPQVARRRSPSLDRALAALERAAEA